MALALLTFKGENGNGTEFELDIGTNKFYKIKIGISKVITQGLELIDDIDYETPIKKGPDFNVFNSRFTVTIPADKFSNQLKYVQLFSFKDERKKSPAVSKVVQVFPMINLLNEGLLVTTSALNITNNNQYHTGSTRAISFSFQEAELSIPMFWDALIEVARLLAPSAVNALASLVGAGDGQSKNNENIVKIIGAVLDMIKQNQNATVSKSTVTPTAPIKTTSLLPAISKSQSYTKDYLPFQRRIFNNYETPSFNRFSRQQFAFAALIPFLGPLLQNAPQLLQVLADSPMKLLNVLNEGISQQGQLQLQKKLADQQHIENLLAEASKNYLLLQQILRSAASALPVESPPSSTSASQSSMSFSFTSTRPASSIFIQKDNPITVNGKPKFVYSGKGSIKLLAHLNFVEGAQNGKIAKAIIDLCVKDASTSKIILEKSFRIKDISTNSMQELELLPPEVQNLPRNKDLIISVSARYLGAKNKPYTCGANLHLIFITDDYFYKSIGNRISESIPLTDKTKYRIFWNKIWEGGTETKKRWKVDLTAKYYIYYRYDQSTNGRIETKILQAQSDEESERELNITGKMKSGLEVTPNELNNLLPTISSYSSLEELKLRAFKTDELNGDYNSEALTSLKMKGKTDERGMIWTYPEITLFEFILNKISKVDQNGQVTEITEEKIIFPKPVFIHFIGEKTVQTSYRAQMGEEDASDENQENSTSEGYEKVFDIKVELRPVELTPLKIVVKK